MKSNLSKNYICRVCRSNKTTYLGDLPMQRQFAGKDLKQLIKKSSFYKCNSCLLLLRHPILSVADYNKLYKIAESTVWNNHSSELRQDQLIVKNMILTKRPNGCKVLDIGCYTGFLLDSLSDKYTKFGIEMSDRASSVATKKNITIIGSDLYNINTEEKFDLILSVDVIEHTENPHAFLERLVGLLNDGGEIIISTGNVDNWLWKYLKNRFWYCKFYEHISFIGTKWVEKYCTQNNMILTNQVTFNYSKFRFKSIVKNLVGLILSLLKIKPEQYSHITSDHFCFSIKIKAN